MKTFWTIISLLTLCHTTACQNLNCAPIQFTLDSIIEVKQVMHPTKENGHITLYQTNATNLTWCESYELCQSMSINSGLLTLPTKQLQEFMMNFNDTPAQAWVSGARKNSDKWTWVNSTLDDCHHEDRTGQYNFSCFDTAQGGEEYAIIFTFGNDNYEIFTATLTGGSAYQPACINMSIDAASTWLEGQMNCVNKESRLATLDEASTYLFQYSQVSYLGLQYRPWIWVSGDSAELQQPVLYNSWPNSDRKNAGIADCLSVALGGVDSGDWMDIACDKTLEYFMCEDLPPEPTTAPTETGASSTTNTPVTTREDNDEQYGTPGEPTDSKMKKGSGCGTGCIAGICCGILVPLVIIGIIVYFCCCKKNAKTCCKKGATPVTTSSGLSNPAGPNNYIDVPNEGVAQVIPYEIADVSKLEGGQSEAAAYRPSSAQYAEVGGVSLQIDSKKAPANTVAPSEYSLARPISEGPTGGPATYGEVKKRDDDDEVILVDNQNYGAYNPAVDGNIPSGAVKAKQLPPIDQDKESNKPAPATKPPKPPKNAKPLLEPKEV